MKYRVAQGIRKNLVKSHKRRTTPVGTAVACPGAGACHNRAMAIDHYENFPVASLVLPRRLRPAVIAIYRFARTADDIADEGDAPPEWRLARLRAYRVALEAIQTGQSPTDSAYGSVERDEPDDTFAPRTVFAPLAQVIRQHELPIAPFYRLLSAFEQDVTVKQYDTAAAIFDYCSRSANPVGELMLRLYGHYTEYNARAADAICTGLQLANFCQDVALDEAKGRVYIPRSDLKQYGLSPNRLSTHRDSPAWQLVMQQQVQRARDELFRGAHLALQLPGRIGWELRLVVCGGLRILERIEAVHYNVFDRRPTLNAHDWALMLHRAFRYQHVLRQAARRSEHYP